MPPPRDDQYICISPTESAEEDAGMEPASAAPRSAPSEDGQKGGKGQIRLPAMTPRTPDPKSVGFQQFCDGLRTDLPGGVALIQVPGLLQGTRGPNSVRLHPWSMTLQERLDTRTGRPSLNTYCVSVNFCRG